MIIAILVFTTLIAGATLKAERSVNSLIGKSPEAVATMLGLDPTNARRISAVTVQDGRRLFISNPNEWTLDATVCGHGKWADVETEGVSTGLSTPRLVFVDGRLERIKGLQPDLLANVGNSAGDLPGEQVISVLCGDKVRPRSADMLAAGLFFGPYIGLRLATISKRHSEGRQILSQFRMGASPPDLERLRAEHPDAVYHESDARGGDWVRIRYGANPGMDQDRELARDFDFYVEIKNGEVISFRQGYLAMAKCMLTSDDQIACS